MVTTVKSNIKETNWPDSCPRNGEEYFVSIGCGNSTVHWALHHTASKFDTQLNLQPVIIWKTPHVIEEDLGGDEATTLARLIPRRLQKFLFGDTDVFTTELAETVANNRGHKITCYIVSSNDQQAEYVATLLKSVPCRLFRMKGEDFFSKSEGRYDTMGIDRCACLRGSVAIYGSPMLVIDGGSALTYTAANSKGKIMGGGIAPGLKMRLESLKKGTGALPGIKIEEVLKLIRKSLEEKRPLPTFSKNTDQAIITTALNEIVSLLGQVIKMWLEQVGPGSADTDESLENNPSRIITVTGGSAEVIAKLLQENSGGIVEFSNDNHGKYEVAWEKTLLHIGVAATLSNHVIKTPVAKKAEKEDKKSVGRKSITKDKYVGKRVAKYFDQADMTTSDHMYRGTIKEVNRKKNVPYYFVVYDDGDNEQVSLEVVEGKNG